MDRSWGRREPSLISSFLPAKDLGWVFGGFEMKRKFLIQTWHGSWHPRVRMREGLAQFVAEERPDH